MKQLAPLILASLLIGCGSEEPKSNTLTFELIDGSSIEFPVTGKIKLQHANTNIYSDDNYVGYVNRDRIPAEEQPQFMGRAIKALQDKNRPLEVIKKNGFYGYKSEHEGFTLVQLIPSSHPDLLLSVSAKNDAIDGIIESLISDQ